MARPFLDFRPTWSALCRVAPNISGSVRLRATKFIRTCGTCTAVPLCRFQDGQHGRGAAKGAQPAMVGGDMLVVAGAGSEKVAQLVVTATEPGG